MSLVARLDSASANTSYLLSESDVKNVKTTICFVIWVYHNFASTECKFHCKLHAWLYIDSFVLYPALLNSLWFLCLLLAFETIYVGMHVHNEISIIDQHMC